MNKPQNPGAKHASQPERLLRAWRAALPGDDWQQAGGIALGLQDRMHEPGDRVPGSRERHRQRIDEEGHVVGDQFDHRVASARARGGRLQHANQRLPGAAHGAEGQL